MDWIKAYHVYSYSYCSICVQILSDMHESQITALPPELQREARGLRREYTERHGFEDSLYSLRSDGTTQNNQPRSTNNTSSTSVHPVT